MILVKFNIVLVCWGYWGFKFGESYIISIKVYGKCGFVYVCFILVLCGVGIVVFGIVKKVFVMVGFYDVYMCFRGYICMFGNFVKATYEAFKNFYGFLMSDLWVEICFVKLLV